jgi:CheY-like chemotaxis protein/predicted regulator of Ras-like GTPase activity (Roadblock/LC7/MglB family)
MSDQWRILVVEDEENLNWSIVNSLRKDGYFVQGVMSGVEAIRRLWSEEYDVVISDLKMPGADGFELLQWLRMHRPRTRLIMVTAFGSASTRTQALEGGVVSYLEKPFDLHTLKEELRRLLQQTGFSANLDSFDLLDVIQIITMSRKSIALLVNTGLEERGVLGFQGGELVWAEYGSLRGEEAFFALAAHKNGVVIHQPWNEQITANVTQPLSRLIFQALQYRTKYAADQQYSSEHEAVSWVPVFPVQEQDDDRPFMYLAESREPQESQAVSDTANNSEQQAAEAKEWWQQTGWLPRADSGERRDSQVDIRGEGRFKEELVANSASGDNSVPSSVQKMPVSQRIDLPSWLTDQPTMRNIPVLRPSLLNSTEMPVARSSPAEWQTPPMAKMTEQAFLRPTPVPQAAPATNTTSRHPSSPEWQPSEPTSQLRSPSGSLKNLASPRKTGKLPISNEQQEDSRLASVGSDNPKRALKRNYSTLVSSLQTLGYSIHGFIATAVVTLDGHPIAQVAVDDLDISPLYGYFSTVLQGVLYSLECVNWGDYEDTVITSANRHILLRLVGNESEAFHVLITTHEADLLRSLEMMANVAEAIAAALS